MQVEENALNTFQLEMVLIFLNLSIHIHSRWGGFFEKEWIGQLVPERDGKWNWNGRGADFKENAVWKSPSPAHQLCKICSKPGVILCLCALHAFLHHWDFNFDIFWMHCAGQIVPVASVLYTLITGVNTGVSQDVNYGHGPLAWRQIHN